MKINKKTIFVATTAINRSELHKLIIPKWYKFINSIDKTKYNVIWFINIDYIDLLKEDIEKTKITFKNIIKDIPIIFIEKNNIEANFFNACLNIGIAIENKIDEENISKDDAIIFWLEDDWEFIENNIKIQEIIENYLSNMTYINLSCLLKNYIHALAPSIISYNLWFKLHLSSWKTHKEDYIDPESCAGFYVIRNFSTNKWILRKDRTNFKNIRNCNILYSDNYNYEELENEFFNDFTNCYYTYDNETKLKDNSSTDSKKYIKKADIKYLNKDKMVFIRLLPTLCEDSGREFMKTKNIKKIKNSKKFYESFQIIQLSSGTENNIISIALARRGLSWKT